MFVNKDNNFLTFTYPDINVFKERGKDCSTPRSLCVVAHTVYNKKRGSKTSAMKQRHSHTPRASSRPVETYIISHHDLYNTFTN